MWSVEDPPAGRRHRWTAVGALLVLAPWAAECSWGGFAVSDYPLVIVVLAPMYGGAAVLIREAARRTGGGWPAIVLLAAAFGVTQAGLVDQSLFNPGYLDDTEYAGLASTATLVPVFGFSAAQALEYVGNHVLLSICAPIMLVESALRPRLRHRPLLSRRGLLAVAVLYVLGSLMIFADSAAVVTPVQAGLAVTVVLVLAAAALLPRRRVPLPRPGRVPHPLLFGLLVLAAHLGLWFATDWPGVGARIAAAVAVTGLVTRWSRRSAWTQRHVVAGWSAGLVAAAAGAGLVPAYEPASPLLSLASDATVVVLTLALVTAAYRLAGPGAGSLHAIPEIVR